MTELLNIPSRPIDHLALCGAAGDTALIARDGDLDFAGLEAQVGRLAHWLRSEGRARGAAPGARVASWIEKSRLACLLPLAVARAGMVHVPVNPLLKSAQLGHIMADSGAVMLITNAARAAMIANPAFAVHDADAVAAIAAGAGDTLPPSDARPDDLAAILYTSGSTGRPKGVVLSHANMWLGAESVAQYLRLTRADRVLAVLPFSFDYGQNQIFSAWHAGAAVAPLSYLMPRDVVRAIDRLGITTLAGVPPLWVQLVECEWPAGSAATLRRLTNSGGALTRPLVAQLRALFPHVDLYPMYGLTEAFRSTYLDPALVDAHPDSMGRAIPHAEILVCRPDGSLTDDGEPGELVHCGPLVAKGYWQDAARSAQRFRPAPKASRMGGTCVWSGDTVRRDGDGLLYFVSRDDAMIKTAGNRVSPGEVEEVAVQAPGVREAVAFGVPDPRLGAAIVLIVRGDGDEPAQSGLAAHLRATLPNFMQPRDVIWCAELPHNPNGKLDRVQIALDYAQERAA
ncbi:MAG: hypothetical protein RLZZ58_51 [Pseudomonadota bacterium]